MLQTLLDNGIGTNDVECFVKEQTRKRIGKRKKKRDSANVRVQMERKVGDNNDLERAVRKMRGRLRQ